MVKGVLFDLDGVLIDTESYQFRGWVEVLKPYRLKLSKKEYIEKYAGKTGEIIEGDILKSNKLSLKKGFLLHKKEKLLMKWFRTKRINKMRYAKEAVEFVIKNKMAVGLVSSGPRDEIVLKLKRSGLYRFFKIIVTKEDVKIGKPNPEIYLKGLQKLGLKARECIAFEDTQYGLQAAVGAGIRCFVVPTEFSRQQDFSKATCVFKNLEEAIIWVKNNHFRNKN